MKVFVDTSALVALENRRDAVHAQAVRAYRKMLKASNELLTSDYVFDETITLLKRRAGATIAAEWGRRLLSSRLFEVVFVDRAALDAGLQIFEQTADQPFSFTDCTSFALMRARDVGTAFAFDRDFTRFGFELLPRS